jgi:predicted Rossmann-fold nucleotide-binding protein
MPEFRPDLEAAFECLCAHGRESFDDERVTELTGHTYVHASRGEETMSVDERILPTIGRVYTDDEALAQALEERGAQTAALDDALTVIRRRMARGVMWGFSGFATKGFECDVEGKGMRKLYDYIAEDDTSADGAASAGVLGLNSVLARMNGVQTIGFSPRQGLSSISHRDHLVVKYHTYRQRERLIGAVSDVLVCAAGGEGARRELQRALNLGAIGLILALEGKEYGPNTLPGNYQTFETLRNAEADGQLVVCRSAADIPAAVSDVVAASAETRDATRPVRLEAIRGYFAGPDEVVDDLE